MSKGPRLIVGWRERIDLPALELVGVRAKVDTGARTSSLHANGLEVVERRSGDRVRFTYELESGDPKQIDLPLKEMRWVKSSNGAREHRPVVRTALVIGGLRWTAELTLTARSQMGFPMLLGREALRERFLVDPARSFLHSRRTVGR